MTVIATLIPPDVALAPGGFRVEVEADRTRTELLFSYCVTGPVDRLLIPPVTSTGRYDLLWHHSCFEAFLRPAGGTAYLELNFSPSSRWAAYEFDGFRAGMRNAGGIGTPSILTAQSPTELRLNVTVPLLAGQMLPHDLAVDIGLSTILEDKEGHLSFWALAHPPEKPDFHHGDCFARQLAAPKAP